MMADCTWLLFKIAQVNSAFCFVFRLAGSS